MTDTTLVADLPSPPLAAAEGAAPADEGCGETGRMPLLTPADLRFFTTCYLAGLVFFLVMLS